MLKQLLAGLLLLLHHAYLSNSQTCTDGNLRLVCCQMIAYRSVYTKIIAVLQHRPHHYQHVENVCK